MNPFIPKDAADQVAERLRRLGLVDPDDDTMPVFMDLEDQEESGHRIDHWVTVEGIAANLVQLVQSWSKATTPRRVLAATHRLTDTCGLCDADGFPFDTATDRFHFALGRP